MKVFLSFDSYLTLDLPFQVGVESEGFRVRRR